MTPVFPYLIRRSKDGWIGELLLRLRHGKSAYVVHLSLEQARQLAVEMRGLATDICPQHHLTMHVVEALGAKISHVIIKPVDNTGGVVGIMCLVTPSGLRDIDVDAAAALAMAIHMALPIFMDGDFTPADGNLWAVQGPMEKSADAPIPEAFRQVIEGLDMPSPGEDLDR